MTLFEQLKKEGVPGKTILISPHGRERYFMGFSPVKNEKIITIHAANGCPNIWDEYETNAWIIKKPEPLKYEYENYVDHGSMKPFVRGLNIPFEFQGRKVKVTVEEIIE